MNAEYLNQGAAELPTQFQDDPRYQEEVVITPLSPFVTLAIVTAGVLILSQL